MSCVCLYFANNPDDGFIELQFDAGGKLHSWTLRGSLNMEALHSEL